MENTNSEKDYICSKYELEQLFIELKYRTDIKLNSNDYFNFLERFSIIFNLVTWKKE